MMCSPMALLCRRVCACHCVGVFASAGTKIALSIRRHVWTDWFVGGQTNLCHNAVDRHLKTRADARTR